MTVKFSNDASTTLTSGITATATSLSVTSAANFPSLNSGEYTYITLSNVLDTQKEIVKCTAISGTTFTVTRGVESTTAQSFSSGDRVQIRITAGLFGDALDEKVDDSQVQTNVPSGAVFTDTVYSHPSTHSASMLTGALPAIDGSALTNMPAGGATNIDGLTDGYYAGGSVGLGDGALENDDGSARHSTAVGFEALSQSTTGWGNVGLGYRAGRQVTDGYYNTAVGKEALRTVTTGDENTANGATALFHLTTGSFNSAFGTGAMYNATTGYSNSALGREALIGVTTGAYNVGIGMYAGSSITTGSNNTVIGKLSGSSTMADTVLIGAGTTERLKIDSTGLFVNGSSTALAGGASSIDGLSDATTSGSFNIGLGANNLTSLTSGHHNTATGEQALFSNTTASYNTATGTYALRNNTSGHSNVASGYDALKGNTTGYSNIAIGYQALLGNTTGTKNSAVASESLRWNTTGSENTAIGYQALYSNTTAYYNTALGRLALMYNTTGAKNIGLGYGAGDGITTGSNNTVIGDLAGTAAMASTVLIGAGTTERLKITAEGSGGVGLYINGVAAPPMILAGGSVGVGYGALLSDDGTSNHNTAMGDFALRYLSTGAGNVAIGSAAADNITTGSNNVAVGKSALGLATTSVYNTALGGSALLKSTGNSNTSVGYKSLESATTAQRNIALGHEAGASITTGQNNTVIGSLAGTTTMADTVLIGAGTTERLKIDSTGLYVNGSSTALVGGASSIDGLSDGKVYSTSVALGSYALATGSGDYKANTAIGHEALRYNTTGNNHTAVGYQALFSTTGNFGNSAFGSNTLKLNTSGWRNNAFGYKASSKQTTANYNNSFGYEALVNVTTGSSNIGIGHSAGNTITTGYNNTVIGTLLGTTTMTGTVLIGAGTTERLKIDSTGLYVNGSSTALAGGASSIDGLSDAIVVDNSIGFGTGALANDDGTANNNIAFGPDALNDNTSGNNNTAIGPSALRDNIAGYNNTAVGGYSMLLANDASFYGNTALGWGTLRSNLTGSQNTANGYLAMYGGGGNANAAFNSAYGAYSLNGITTGTYNTALGRGSSRSITEGSYSTSVGGIALELLTTGQRNIGLGYKAGRSITTGSQNTVIGELFGSANLANTVLIGAGPIERLKIDSTGLYVNGAAFTGGVTPLVKTASYTASSGELVVAAVGGIAITLPASPSVGDHVSIKDGTGAASTTAFTVARNGSNIASSATDLTFNQDWKEIRMVYINSTIGWSA